ncbi:MAG: hypothetical protein ACUVV0_13465 [Anaerolineae bacterium]
MEIIENLRQIAFIFIALSVVSLLLALLLLLLIYRRLRRLNVPPDADFLTCLRIVPLSLVILLDILDFGLDFLAIPFAWVLLGHFKLGGLRGVTVVEELIPGTQLLPTMTATWLAVRLYDFLGGKRIES